VAASDLPIALVVDDQDRPMRWLSERALTEGERVPSGEPRHEHLLRVELDDVMRDALGRLLDDESRYAPVVDEGGRVAGILSMEVISHALHLPPEEAHSTVDLLDEEPEPEPA
jgi:hypothetical protein